MKCKFEHDGDCCNSGAKQYMCKCQKRCDAIIPMTNAQKIRSMSDDELNELFNDIYNAGAEDAVAYEWGQRTNSFEWTTEWLQQPAGEEDKHEQTD